MSNRVKRKPATTKRADIVALEDTLARIKRASEQLERATKGAK